MATRNQTALFRKYRDALRQVRPFAGTSSASASGSQIELVAAPLLKQPGGADSSRAGSVAVSLPPAWVDVSEQVQADMQNIRSRMADLAKAHGRALMPTFDDDSGDQHTVELLSNEITKLLKRSEQRLQQLSKVSGSQEDANLRRNVQRSLATDLQSLSLEFRKQQKGYLQRLRQQQEGGSADGIGVDLQSKREEDTSFFDPGFNEQQVSLLKHSEAQSLEREKEITQIVSSVNDLAQIMKELSALVIDQGTIVDRIDFNIQNVAASVEQGVKELEQAERTQKRGGMVVCVMVLIAAIMFMLFLLIVKKLVF